MTQLQKIRLQCVRLLYAAANLLLAMLQGCLWPRQRPRQAQRVCIYRIGNIGDILCALPAMYAIRRAYPDAKLTLLTSPGKRGALGAAELLEGARWLDELLVYYSDDIDSLGKRCRLLGRLRHQPYDVWIELPRECGRTATMLRNMAAARLAGARWACGWQLNTIRWAAQAQSEFFTFPNEAERLLALLAGCGIQSREVVFPLPLSDRHRRSVDELLGKNGLTGKPLVAIAPGAKRSTNRWPADRFAEVGRHLIAKGFGLVVMGGAADAGTCRDVATAAGPGALAVAGQSSLLESAELLKRCYLVICNDSGVQHLAAAVGKPCLSLFAASDFRGKWYPYGSQHTVLRKWVECHTCLLERCPYDNRCLKLIEADEVIAVADQKLADLQNGVESEKVGPHPSRGVAAGASGY